MKKLTILLIALLVMSIMLGCGEGRRERDSVGSGQDAADNVGLSGAARYYDVQTFHLDIDSWQLYLLLHQEQLHLLQLEVDEDTLNSYIHLLTMDADGTNVQTVYRTLLDENVDYFNILGFEKHDDGYISLVLADNMLLPPHTREDVFEGLGGVEVSQTYVYRRISPDGEIVSEIDIDALNNDGRQLLISDVAFDLEGNVVASATLLSVDIESSRGQGIAPEDIGSRSFLLFDSGLAGNFSEVEDLTSSLGLFNRTNDGQIIVPSNAWAHETDMVMFYEIDFENTAITDGSVIEAEIPIDSIGGVFPAPQTSEFDFYLIGNDRELVGYRKSDGSFIPLIDFLRLGISFSNRILDRNSFFLWDDGRITIADRNWNASSGREEVTIYLLTPSDEPLPSEVIEREVITLGGINIIMNSLLIEQVAAFNRQSDTHRLETMNYAHGDIDRLRTELITGRGPDIFMLSWSGAELVSALAEGHFILDMYPMIDADPDLNREDFFPSVLSAWENSRGELIQIAPDFSITTTIGMQSVFPEAPENWNYADFISFYQEARAAGYDYPLGQEIDRLLILRILLFADDTFFCERDATANFDSESFIDVLNFVMSIPADQGWDRVSHLVQAGQWRDPVSNLQRGEQRLLPFVHIGDMLNFRALQARLGSITAFGFPSNDAPTHAVQVPSGTAIGIRSNSPHIEAAWEFVRLGLLPGEFHDRGGFPLRIELFEQQLYNAQKREAGFGFFDGIDSVFLELPPMTESDADVLRELVSNIGHILTTEHPVLHIVNEDVQTFFAGTRSAEDTARIIQSRVSILLAERKR